MRKFLIASALAATALTTPAFARDGSAYVGIEGGVLIMDDRDLTYIDNNILVQDAYVLSHDWGWDVDLIAGYDMGMIRVEGELGYKRASADEVFVSPQMNPALGAPPEASFFAADGSSSALSVMVNALIDFGDDYGWSGYLGGGVGMANVKTDFDIIGADRYLDAERNRFAWQAIAGVRTALTPNIDIGLKYRFFNVDNVDYHVDAAAGGGIPFEVEGRWRSHSLLASLIYNFGAPPAPPLPPPPPPPPPAAPATQTCPDGTVVLATEPCPLPPPPPPPPPPAPERG